MIYDDQPQMVRANGFEGDLEGAFAAIDREALIEKAALGVARFEGVQEGDRIKARKVLVAAGILSPHQPKKKAPPSEDDGAL